MNTKAIITIMIFTSFLLPVVSSNIKTDNFSNIMNTIYNNILDIKNIYLKNLTGCYDLIASDSVDSFQIYCHMPIVCESQSPIIVNNVWTEPVNKVTEFGIANDYSSLNSLLRINLLGMTKGETLKLFWSISVVVRENNFDDLPENIRVTPRKDLPNDVKKWLLPSEFIQSDHWRINLRAKMLKGMSNDVIKLAEKVADFTGPLESRGGYQDALTTLRTKGGNCMGSANLASALLRANGIPARVLMVYPTHYIIEYYAHPYGWIRLESDIGRMPEWYQNYTIQFIAFPCDETSSNIINGHHPEGGLIAYWGTSNANITWSFNWSFCEQEIFQLSSNIFSIDKVLNITEKVWDYYEDYLNRNMSDKQKNHFLNATNSQKLAIGCFEVKNLEGYIENMSYSLSEYQRIEDKFRGIAVGSDIIGDESSISEILTFIEECNINHVIVDFGWITWSWENTQFEKVADFLNETQQRNITLWLMYRARTLPGDGYNIPHQVHRNGEIDEREICFSNKKSRDWAISWSDKLLEKYPMVNGIILYDPRFLSDCCYCFQSNLKFILETKTLGFPRFFRQGMEKYDLWMEWRSDEIEEFIKEWRNYIKQSYPNLEIGSVLLPEEYGAYNMAQDMSKLESNLNTIFPFVALDNVSDLNIAGRICNKTKEKVSCQIVSNIKIYGPYNNTDNDIVNAIKSSMESNGDGFFIWCYDCLDPEKYDLNKIINAYNGIYN
ncbi:MAG: transglutaminase domain-containing protein [Methanobacteriota archaeon]